jgi:hypothetical protein
MNRKFIFSVLPLGCLLAFSLVFVSCGGGSSSLNGTTWTSGDHELICHEGYRGMFDNGRSTGQAFSWGPIKNKNNTFDVLATNGRFRWTCKLSLSGKKLTVIPDAGNSGVKTVYRKGSLE